MRTIILRAVAVVAVLAILLVPALALTASAGYERPTFNHGSFQYVWDKFDGPVLSGTSDRSWSFGPALAGAEQIQIEDGMTVQYFEKARMELADPTGDPANSLWVVRNGRLVSEMVTGLREPSPGNYVPYDPAQIPVAGDLDQAGPDVVTYGWYLEHYKVDHYPVAPELEPTLRAWYGDDWVYVVGYTIGPAWRIKIKVDGQEKEVVYQAFERQGMTFTPDNPPQWQVELTNVGQHYYKWRYQNNPDDGHGPDQPYQFLEDGWTRVVHALETPNCSWDFQFRVTETIGDVVVDFPKCGELRVRGEGIAKIEVRPDAEFYNPAKHLSWWGQGEDSAGKVSVLKRDGSWTDWLTPSQAGDGIDFAHDGGVRKFEVQATGGSVSFFLGEGIGKL